MSVPLYPIAHNATEIALNWPREGQSLAAREREARDLSGKDVTFVRETIEPAFPSEAQALTHYETLLSQPFATLVCGFERTAKLLPPAVPTLSDGKRWPAKRTAPPMQWRLAISYWKITHKRVKPVKPGITPDLQARALRKKALDVALTPEDVLAIAHAPLMAYRPQKSLDFGLFDFPLPENPAIIIADE